MTLIVPAVLGGLALTVMALVSLAAARKGKHPAAPQGPTVQPRILVHSINDDRCTGCDACVAVCPTNVLDLVDNKSRVLRFQDCIQCEACMWACPTTALVMHLEGAEPPPYKMPELDESFQTAVPGQYLIGEVAGKPLVKNAANLGRMVVEHMLQTGVQPGAMARMGDPSAVDVAIVGSGPGGLSAALTCIQRGLSYVLLEKEQLVASTIARYPKGKLVMAEPYDVRNLSLLPVFDSSKEQIIPIWEQLMQMVGVQIRKGEAVEEVVRQPDGTFHIRTIVGAYRAQRVVLATGTRGKPRTLGVPGENLPKVQSLLDDPDDFRGKPVIVVGGGDSAVEAAIALADSGARVILSYRGRSFNRAQPKNKQTIESYDAQKRVKIRYQSNIVEFAADTVTLEMSNGQRKTYPNEAAFVLIGSDPPIRWLEKLGVHFIERPHQYQLGKTDDLLARLLGGNVAECPQDAGSAAAVITGQAMPQQALSLEPQIQMQMPMQDEPSVSGPRKWLRSATAIFSLSSERSAENKAIPLSEFAKRSRRHTGHGRRDALDASERTRVLRMLRDEGGRIADEESRIDIPALAPSPAYAYDEQGPPEFLDEQVVVPSAPPPPPMRMEQPPMRMEQPPMRMEQPPMMMEQQPPSAPPHAPTMALSAATDGANPFGGHGEMAAKPAVIVGLDRARASRRSKGGNPMAGAPPPAPPRKRPTPAAFVDEPTRQVDADSALAQLLRDQSRRPDEMAYDFADDPVAPPPPARSANPFAQPDVSAFDEPTRAVDAEAMLRSSATASHDVASTIDLGDNPFAEDDPTRAIDVNRMDKPRRARKIRYPERPEDRFRRRPRRPESISDIDWDLD